MSLLSGLRTLVVQGSSPSIRANAVFHVPCRLSHCPSAIPGALTADAVRSVLLPHLGSHPAPFLCHNHLCLPSRSMLSRSQQSCAEVTRNFSQLSRWNSKLSEHQHRLLSATATRPLWACFRWLLAGFRSREAGGGLIIRYTRLALTTGCMCRLDSRRNSVVSVGNLTWAIRPRSYLSGTALLYRQNRIVVYDSASQTAGEP